MERGTGAWGEQDSKKISVTLNKNQQVRVDNESFNGLIEKTSKNENDSFTRHHSTNDDK